MYVFPSLVNLNHQLASRFVPAVLPALLRVNTELVLRLVLVITVHSSVSMSYLRPNSSYASILSIMFASSVVENAVVNAGITALRTAPSGTMLLSVIGPKPDSRFPTPLLAPSPATAPIFTHSLSSAFPVVDVTNFPLRNFLVSGDVNFISAPVLAYFRFEVAKSPMISAPPDVK